MLWDDPEGRVGEGGVCIHTADSHHCTAETSTTLSRNHANKTKKQVYFLKVPNTQVVMFLPLPVFTMCFMFARHGSVSRKTGIFITSYQPVKLEV